MGVAAFVCAAPFTTRSARNIARTNARQKGCNWSPRVVLSGKFLWRPIWPTQPSTSRVSSSPPLRHARSLKFSLLLLVIAVFGFGLGLGSFRRFSFSYTFGFAISRPRSLSVSVCFLSFYLPCALTPLATPDVLRSEERREYTILPTFSDRKSVV